MELQHSGDFTLAIGCANIEDDDDGSGEHRIIIAKPDKPVIRKLLRKIDVREQVAALMDALCDILENDARIAEIKTEAY